MSSTFDGLSDYVFYECLESIAVFLNYGNGNMSGFTGVYVSGRTGFSGVCSAYNCA